LEKPLKATAVVRRGPFAILPEMSRDADNVTIARRGYSAFNDGHYEGVVAVLDSEIVWDASGGFPDGVVYHGHEGFREFLQDAFKIWDTFELEPSEFHASGEHVLVLGWVRLRARNSGVEVRPRWGWVWQIRNAKAVALLNFIRWEEATAQFEAAVRRARQDQTLRSSATKKPPRIVGG
jgi:uncharacterized protein